MDRTEYSAYHEEYSEILLQDGIGFSIQSIEDQVYTPKQLSTLPNVKEWGL